jgi:hypothetical protein
VPFCVKFGSPSWVRSKNPWWCSRATIDVIRLITLTIVTGSRPDRKLFRARSPSAVSEARFDRRMMSGQPAPARFRYSDLKEAARRRTRALWGLNGMEGWCPGVSNCCRRARKTTADAVEFRETQDDRGIKTGEAGKSRLVEAPGTEGLRAPRHAKIS